jgi:hypothetical protein
MVSVVDSPPLSTSQIHLQPILAKKDGISYRFASTLTARIHLHAITAREDGVSYRFGSTLYSTDSLTRYNSQRRCC